MRDNIKLIVGLGNPGMQYTDTRHNIGFKALDAIAHLNNININRSKFKSLYGEGKIGANPIILVKPQTYMNLSGEAVAAFASWYKIDYKDILIIYDDVSLDVGQIRIRTKGSAGGHNGIKSIIQHIGKDEFERIKVGVGEKPAGWDLANYVLGKFSDEEMKRMNKTMDDVADAAKMIVVGGAQEAMNMYNSKARG